MEHYYKLTICDEDGIDYIYSSKESTILYLYEEYKKIGCTIKAEKCRIYADEDIVIEVLRSE